MPFMQMFNYTDYIQMEGMICYLFFKSQNLVFLLDI